jgi:hypothetical protein
VFQEKHGGITWLLRCMILVIQCVKLIQMYGWGQRQSQMDFNMELCVSLHWWPLGCWSQTASYEGLYGILVHIETRKHQWDLYLGTQVSKFWIHGAEDLDKPCWAMLETYVKQAVAYVETELEKVDQCLPTCVTTPLSQGYCPKLDQSRELECP